MAIALLGAAGAAEAQTPRTQAQCNGQVITEVVIRAHAPSYGGVFARSPFLGRLVTSLHVVTAPEVVENLVLLKRGDRCSALLRRETERVLRAQPFLADAFVTAFPDGPDAVRIEVATIDEPSAVGSIGVRGAPPYVRALTLGNNNLQGRGVETAVGWREGYGYRDTFLGRYTNYQLFDRPFQMSVEAARRDHGADASFEVTNPFLSDVQRSAWRFASGASEMLIPFRSPGEERRSIGLRRQHLDLGGMLRRGAAGRFVLAGASFSTERAIPSTGGVLVTDTGLVRDPSGALDGRFVTQRSTRLNVLLGASRVNFLRVTGFDALSGSQDIQRGVQVGLTLGRSLPIAGSPPNELFAAANLYAGAGSSRSFAAMELIGEGRHAPHADRWDALLVSGRVASYLRPHPRHTVIASAEYGAARRQRVPFQFALGDRRGGARGYERAELGGAARLVTRLEERWRVGNIRGTADAGVALFLDAGRLWAGDAVLGQNTGYLSSVGVGLLAAIPPGSRRTWRLDVAFPLQRDAGARWGIRITNDDRTRAFWPEPGDVRHTRDRMAGTSIFSW